MDRSGNEVRLGLFGGTFDPWHLGHELVLQRVMSSALVDGVLVAPAAIPPHKPSPLSTFTHRLAMTRLALAGRPTITVSDIEHRLPPPSYTLHTVQRLLNDYCPDCLGLILGADAFLDLHRWHGASQLLSLVDLLVLTRPPWTARMLSDQEFRLLRLCPSTVVRYIFGPELSISSSEVRRRLAAGEDPASLTPPVVAEYIRQHSLYIQHRRSAP